MHNRNCRIPNCPCSAIRNRYSQLFTQKEISDPSTQSDTMTDRRMKLRLPLASDGYDADDECKSHPHFHLTKRTRPKRVHPKVTTRRRRSKSVDLTPVIEAHETPIRTPMVGGTLLAETPVICNYTYTLADEISISADNLPTLCLNDCPFTPTPMIENRLLKSTLPVVHSQSKLAREKTVLTDVEKLNTSQIESHSNLDRSSSHRNRSTSPAYSTVVTHSDDGSLVYTTEC